MKMERTGENWRKQRTPEPLFWLICNTIQLQIKRKNKHLLLNHKKEKKRKEKKRRMSSHVIDGIDFDPNCITYSPMKAHSSGSKVVNVLNKANMQTLAIQTPLMFTYGAQEGKDQLGAPTGKYTIALQFPNKENNDKEGEAFLETMRSFIARVKADAMTNSKDWFGKQISIAEVIDDKFNVLLRHPKIKGTQEIDDTRAPTMSIKLPCWNGVWKTDIFDEDYQPLFVVGKVNAHSSPLEFLPSRTYLYALIECGGLWFSNGKVAITWNLKQAVVRKVEQTQPGQLLIKLSNHRKEQLKNMPNPEQPVDPDGPIVGVQVEDSDEEDVPVPVPVPVAAPAPVAVKVEEDASAAVSVKHERDTAGEEAPKKKKIIAKKKTEGA
jgi:hypothetical protein